MRTRSPMLSRASALARREAASRAVNRQTVSRPSGRGRKLAHPTHRPQLAEDAAAKRSTVLLGPDGKVQKAWYGVKADGHAAEVLKALEP